MGLPLLIIRNIFRHKLRAVLTISGIAVAMLAFGILKTLISLWYLGVDTSSANRLITRNKISLVYLLPVAYKTKIMQVSEVSSVAHGLWYGGIYKDKKNFFAQLAVSGIEYINLFPEFLLTDKEKTDFERDRNAAVVGAKLADRFGWKIGDVIPLEGTVYPGKIDLVLRGIYRGARKNVDETVMFFRWDYLNELIKKASPDQADRSGWYLVQIKDHTRAAETAEEIDRLFENSLAETLTETEKAFQLGFVAMTDAIVTAVKIIAAVVIAIILIVLANTMAMTARERSSEYAVFKTLGFKPWFIFVLIAGESLALALIGGIIGMVLTIPGANIFRRQLETFLPVFEVENATLVLILVISIGVGLIAALVPALRVSRTGIAEGLRHL